MLRRAIRASPPALKDCEPNVRSTYQPCKGKSDSPVVTTARLYGVNLEQAPKSPLRSPYPSYRWNTNTPVRPLLAPVSSVA